MEHVSTLCAAGTVGIAATGFALGRPSPTKQRPLTARRRQSLLTKSYHSPSESISETRPATAAAHPVTYFSGAAQQDPYLQSVPSRSSQDRQLRQQPSTSLRRPDDRIVPRPRRRTYVGPELKLSEGEVMDDSLVSPSGRPSSSWIRRLSIITSSVNGSSVCDSQPQSPSIHSSNAPFFPSNFPVPSPNKLVKRSTSSHGLPEPQRYQTLGSTPLALLRRPATSHQRSAHMRQRSSTDAATLSPQFAMIPPNPAANENVAPNTFPGGSWRPYFTKSRFTNFSETRRPSTSKHRNRSPRRLVAQPDTPPTLLLASSLSSPSYPARNLGSTSGMDHIGIVKDCDTWNSMDSQGCGYSNQALNYSSSVRPTGGEELVSSWTMPRNVLHQSPYAKDDSYPDYSRVNLVGRSKTERLSGNSIGGRRRGDITNPDIFRRPSTASHSGNTMTRFDRHDIPSEDFVPKARLRHLPNFTNLRCEALSVATPTQRPPVAKPTSLNFSAPNSPIDCHESQANNGTQRHSAAASDPASTLIGSDNDIKVFSSGEEDDTDFQSEFAFDSFPTRAPGSSKSGRRGPRIETIFDQPTPITSAKLVSLPAESYQFKVDIRTNHPASLNHAYNSFSIDRPGPLNVERHSSPAHTRLSDMDTDSSSSPSPLPQRLRRTAKIHNPDSSRPNTACSLLDQLDELDIKDQAGSTSKLTRTSIQRPFSSVVSKEDYEKNTRLCLYDWSEQQAVKKDEQGSDPRPRTSHVDKFLDLRGGRTVIRRTSSTFHLRSQSVPLSREPLTPKESNTAKKFATWGLGNKGASEDWDGDFDFGDGDRLSQISPSEKCLQQRQPSNTVRVPQAIMERQESVYGQFSHVQELTVLVEELKLLRARAKAMNIIEGPSSELWKEAHGIISLATFEEDDDSERALKAKRSIPMSLDNFEIGDGSMEESGFSDSFAITDDQFDNEFVSANGNHSRRSRTDSSIKARYVLDSLHRDRKPLSGHTKSNPDGPQKLAFDTQSLRDLVVRAGVVTRALKDVVRKAEGVCPTPETNPSTPDPPFSKIFDQPRIDSPLTPQHDFS